MISDTQELKPKKIKYTHQTKEDNPRGEDERGEEGRDEARGQLRFRAESMFELCVWMVEVLIWVHGRRRRRRDVKIEKVDCGRVVHEGAEKE